MPMDNSKYPKDWKAISARIRERAQHKCEICGVENHRYIARFIEDAEKFVYIDDEEAMYWNAAKLQEKTIKVVLTVAHLNHDTTDNRDENLKCLCQLHHLRHDAAYHGQNAAKTRYFKRISQIAKDGQLSLFEVDNA